MDKDSDGRLDVRELQAYVEQACASLALGPVHKSQVAGLFRWVLLTSRPKYVGTGTMAWQGETHAHALRMSRGRAAGCPAVPCRQLDLNRDNSVSREELGVFLRHFFAEQVLLAAHARVLQFFTTCLTQHDSASLAYNPRTGQVLPTEAADHVRPQCARSQTRLYRDAVIGSARPQPVGATGA
jgi:hypothetical protein